MNKAIISRGRTPSAPTIPLRIVVPSMAPHARRIRTLMRGTVIKLKWKYRLRRGDEPPDGGMIRANMSMFWRRRSVEDGMGTEEGKMIMISENCGARWSR